MDPVIPRLDKTQLTISSLDDYEEEEKRYWLSCDPITRLRAIEINRRMVYGTDRTTARILKVFEIADLA